VVIALGVITVLNGRTVVHAQSGSYYGATQSYGTQTSGAFGSRSLGSSITPGQGSFASPTFQQFGAGLTQGGQNSTMSGQMGNFIGGLSPNSTFVGANQLGQQGYPQQGMYNSFTSMGGLGGLLSQGAFGRRNLQGRQSSATEANATQASTPIRTQFTAGFDYHQPNSEKLSTSLTQSLSKVSAIHAQTPIEVEIQDRTAILRGVVTTSHDRALAEQWIRLEPGIGQIQNEIVVADSDSQQSSQP